MYSLLYTLVCEMYKISIKTCKTIIILFAMCTIKFVKCTISFFFFTNCTAHLDFTLCTTWQKIHKMYNTICKKCMGVTIWRSQNT